MERHYKKRLSDDTEYIGGIRVIETVHNPDGTVTKRLEDVPSDPHNSEHSERAVENAKRIIAAHSAGRVGLKGSKLRPSAMRRPAPKKPKSS